MPPVIDEELCIGCGKCADACQSDVYFGSVEGETAKGSGRTRGDVNLLEALEVASPHLLRFGGHAAAVGFSLESSQLEALREAWRERRFTMDEIDRYAKICRVERVMQPYLEALVG